MPSSCILPSKLEARSVSPHRPQASIRYWKASGSAFKPLFFIISSISKQRPSWARAVAFASSISRSDSLSRNLLFFVFFFSSFSSVLLLSSSSRTLTAGLRLFALGVMNLFALASVLASSAASSLLSSVLTLEASLPLSSLSSPPLDFSVSSSAFTAPPFSTMSSSTVVSDSSSSLLLSASIG